MKIIVNRMHKDPEYTIGEMTIDGDKCGFTLEDAVREVPGKPVADWKIPGATAIPAGTYEVSVNWSTRFARLMPILLDVPGFGGIRIHSGNTDADTEGCLLVGSAWGGGDWISGSRVAFDAVYDKIYAAYKNGENITLEIA